MQHLNGKCHWKAYCRHNVERYPSKLQIYQPSESIWFLNIMSTLLHGVNRNGCLYSVRRHKSHNSSEGDIILMLPSNAWMRLFHCLCPRLHHKTVLCIFQVPLHVSLYHAPVVVSPTADVIIIRSSTCRAQSCNIFITGKLYSFSMLISESHLFERWGLTFSPTAVYKLDRSLILVLLILEYAGYEDRGSAAGSRALPQTLLLLFLTLIDVEHLGRFSSWRCQIKIYPQKGIADF